MTRARPRLGTRLGLGLAAGLSGACARTPAVEGPPRGRELVALSLHLAGETSGAARARARGYDQVFVELTTGCTHQLLHDHGPFWHARSCAWTGELDAPLAALLTVTEAELEGVAMPRLPQQPVAAWWVDVYRADGTMERVSSDPVRRYATALLDVIYHPAFLRDEVVTPAGWRELYIDSLAPSEEEFTLYANGVWKCHVPGTPALCETDFGRDPAPCREDGAEETHYAVRYGRLEGDVAARIDALARAPGIEAPTSGRWRATLSRRGWTDHHYVEPARAAALWNELVGPLDPYCPVLGE